MDSEDEYGLDDSLILLAVDAKLGCETERRDLQTNLDDHERDGDEFSDGWVWDEECLAACDSVLAGAVKAPEKCSSRSLSQVSTDYDLDLPDITLLLPDGPIEDPPPTSTGVLVPTLPSTPAESSASKRKASESCESTESTRQLKILRSKPQIVIVQGQCVDWDDPSSPIIVAHSPLHQQCFEAKGLCYGVQWEIARMVTNQVQATPNSGPLTFDSILLEMLEGLKGSNAEAAPKTPQHLLRLSAGLSEHAMLRKAFATEVTARAPWKELDVEQGSLAQDPFAGLGSGTTDDPSWYGGKVSFRAQLVVPEPIKDTPMCRWRLVLSRLELGTSCTVMRRFGSSMFIRVKVPDKVAHNADSSKLIEYFSHPFVLLGRVFRGYYAKESVFLVQTNEILASSGITSMDWDPSKPGPMPFLAFLDWFNPIELNQNQTMSKWASRFQLGLSNSVPGVRLLASDIKDEPDVVSANGSDMTDGCGYATKAVLGKMRQNYQWDEFPTAIQCRLAGTKGLFLRHPSIAEESQVWIRPSQRKIRYSSPLDPAMLWIDLLRSSHMRSPGRLAIETIICLAENNVPHHVFETLLQDGVNQVVADLTTWDGKDAMYKLWRNVAKHGCVMSARMARQASGEARVRGLGDRDADGNELEDGEDLKEFANALIERSAAWWSDEISGCPSSLEETVLVLLDAGFVPQTCAVLKERLKVVMNTAISSYLKRCKLEVQMSCIALLVPDPYGVLGPDEIQIKSSHRNLTDFDGFETDRIVGEVLLTRNPCKLPTDIRKLRAVIKPELYDYHDVIVCSVTGMRRLADYLAGGDYDGDKGWACWDPRLVAPFVNADLKYLEEPESLGKKFSKDTERVSDFLQRVRNLSIESRILETQKVTLGALRDPSLVGKYSTYHDKAMYIYGYSHPKTIELAYMFCKILDGAKNGLIVLPQVLKADVSEFAVGSLRWKGTFGDKVDDGMGGVVYAKRGKGLTQFVMDTLSNYAQKEKDRQEKLIKERFASKNHSDVVDADLIAPWQKAEEIASRETSEEGIDRKRRDLDAIAEHVRKVHAEWKQRSTSKRGSSRQKGGSAGSSFTTLPIEIRQDTLRALSRKFASISSREDLLFSPPEIARLAASYAYLYDSEQSVWKWSRFPWDVALRDLCLIKAQTLGPWKAVAKGFYDRFQIRASTLAS